MDAINYKNHLRNAIETFGELSNVNPMWTLGEHCVILLRTNKLTYQQIQKWMGNPSKKWIREVLLKYAPELIELDCNNHKLVAKKSSLEKQVYNLVVSEMEIEIDDEDWTILKNGENIELIDPYGFKSNFKELDERTQNVILLSLKNENK